MDQAGAMTPMPKYRCFKEVWALRISQVEDNGCDPTTDENPIVTVHFDDKVFAPRQFNLRGKPTPEAGWYMIQYEDGYISFSPARAFEEGYMLTSLIPEEPKTLDGKLARLLNSVSAENGSDTPDFILADHMFCSLALLNKSVTAREKWYGRNPEGMRKNT